MGYKLVEVKPGVWELVEQSAEEIAANQEQKSAEEKEKETIKKLVAKEAEKAGKAAIWTDPKAPIVDPYAGFSEAELKVVKDAALKRLLKDLKDCQENPLPTVNALPIGDDMFTWHANLLGSSATIFGGLVFHFILEFPPTYPHRPPKVKMCTKIDHPNIFDNGYICLDMLEQGEYGSFHDRNLRNTGWTTAYSVQSILVQLQNFLSHHAYTDAIARQWGLKMTKESLEIFSCTCGHGVEHQIMIDAEVNEIMDELKDYEPQKYKNIKKEEKKASEEKTEKLLASQAVQKKNIWPPIDPREILRIQREKDRWEIIQKQHGGELVNDDWWSSYLQFSSKKRREALAEEKKWANPKKSKIRFTTNEKKQKRKPGEGVFFGQLVKYEKENHKATDGDVEGQVQETDFGVHVVLPKVYRFPGNKTLPDVRNISMNLKWVKSGLVKNFSGKNISVFRTANGAMFKVEFDETKSSSVLGFWDDVYPLSTVEVDTTHDALFAARRASGIPTPKLKPKEGKKPLHLPANIDILHFEFDGFKNTKTIMEMEYTTENLYVRGTQWMMVCPDEKHKGNIFVISLVTSPFSIHFVKSFMYFVNIDGWNAPDASEKVSNVQQVKKVEKKEEEIKKVEEEIKKVENENENENGEDEPQKETITVTTVTRRGRGRGRGGIVKRVIHSAQPRGVASPGRGGAKPEKKEEKKKVEEEKKKEIPAAATVVIPEKQVIPEKKEGTKAYKPPPALSVVVSRNYGGKPQPGAQPAIVPKPIVSKQHQQPSKRRRDRKGKQKIDEEFPPVYSSVAASSPVIAPPVTVIPVVDTPSPVVVDSPAPIIIESESESQFLENEKIISFVSNSGKKNKRRIPLISWDDLPEEIKLYIFSFLDRKELLRAARVNDEFENLALDSSFWVKQELFCYHTKLNFTEDILGIGINFKYYPNSKRIESADSPLDLLSYTAFNNQGIRKGAWKEPFTHWLPLFISYGHGLKSLPVIKRIMSSIMSETGSENEFQPLFAVDILTTLMNTMIVNLMSCDLWASEKALEGYFAFHHLLLTIVEEYPEVLTWANNRIQEFIESEDGRIKKKVPSLGQFIPLLAITDKYSWKDVSEPLLLEVFDRNQKWALKQYPHLADIRKFRGDVDRNRIIKTFEATKISQKLVMFHVYFLNNIAKPQGFKVADVKRMYDNYYGRPTQRLKYDLQLATKDIQCINNWIEFFARVDMPLPTPKKLDGWLKASVLNSQRKRYHRRSDFEVQPQAVKREEQDYGRDRFDDMADSYY